MLHYVNYVNPNCKHEFLTKKQDIFLDHTIRFYHDWDKEISYMSNQTSPMLVKNSVEDPKCNGT